MSRRQPRADTGHAFWWVVIRLRRRRRNVGKDTLVGTIDRLLQGHSFIRDETGRILVKALAREGHLFVHKDAFGSRTDFVISHEPTGMQVAAFRRKRDAVQAMSELNALPVDWHEIRSSNPPRPEIMAAIWVILETRRK